ncbi:hypothetical protein O181_053237 [Austropuccinia psidii MF-1]|uniref:Integrase zinc-binding domain-containing protein n=1 Tax=Austropuccinia psidii MF-1 TaxID=1389203 RepID=A0A9Q3HRB2_9BASI|nr:hypothetical protein [Austropuccinia psidii MF-1]
MNTILHEFHDTLYSGYLSEDRKIEKVKKCEWQPSWRKETIEYCHTCDRFQKYNSSKGNEFGLIIHNQEPKYPWKVTCMDCVAALPPSGDKSYNSFSIIVEKYSRNPILLPCHKEDTGKNEYLLLYNRVISHTRLSGTKPAFYTAFNPQADGLAERMIQTLKEMIRKLCAYGLEFKDSDGFTHDWCTTIPELEL